MDIKTVSFLVSGRGSNFSAVAKKIMDGTMPARLGILLSDRKDAPALTLAGSYNMQSFFVDPGIYDSRKEYEKEMVKKLKAVKTDLVVAAGFMRILSPYFVKKYRNRIINIHPALLPAFPGIDAQKQALEYGVKISGCTAHFIDEGTDTGPVIIQSAVPLLDSDTETTLSQRILREEHRVLPEAVALFCNNRLKIVDRRVCIIK